MKQRLMWVLWPAFLMAGAAEVLLFAFIDPQDIHVYGAPLGWSREAIYTVSFFMLWGITTASSALTVFLAASPFEVNRCPLPEDNRPDGCPKQACAPAGESNA